MNVINLKNFDFNALKDNELCNNLNYGLPVSIMIELLNDEDGKKSIDEIEDFLILDKNIVCENMIEKNTFNLLKFKNIDSLLIELINEKNKYYLFINPIENILTKNKALGQSRVNSLLDTFSNLNENERNTFNWLVESGGVSSKTIAGYIFPNLKKIKPSMFENISYPHDNADFKRIMNMQDAAKESDINIIKKMKEIADKENLPQYLNLAENYIKIKTLINEKKNTDAYNLIKLSIDVNNTKKNQI